MTTVHCWGVCQDCRDQFTLVFHVRQGEGNFPWPGYLERSSTAKSLEGQVFHRCGGVVKVYGHEHPIKLLG